MDKKLIEKKYNEKLELLKKYNRKYYNDNVSVITDADYDILKKDIIDLEKKFNFLKSKNSPSNSIGFKPSKIFKKVSHKVPMLKILKGLKPIELDGEF